MVTRKDMRSRRDEYSNSLTRQSIISTIFFNLKRGEEGKQRIITGIGGDRSNTWFSYTSENVSSKPYSAFVVVTDSSDANLDALEDKLIEVEKKYSLINPIRVMVDTSGRTTRYNKSDWNAYSYSSADRIIRPVVTYYDNEELINIMNEASRKPEWNAFPYPYFSDANPLIKFQMLNDNFFINGKWRMEDVLKRSLHLCSLFSADTTREQIRVDLSSVLTTAIKSGTLRIRGGFLMMPKSETGFTQSFLRKYIDYEERLGKTTLFDFESLKLNY